MVRTMPEEENQNSCGQRPCQSKPSPNIDDVNAELKSRPLLYTGVVWIGLLRRFLIPRTCGSALPPPSACHPSTCTRQGSEDPIPEKQQPVAQSVSHVAQDSAPTDHLALLSSKRPNEDDEKRGELRRRQKKENEHSSLAAIIAQVQEAADQARRISQDISSLVQDGKTTTSETLSTIREEKSRTYRWSVITVSGLISYLVGVRRGGLTRIIYTATGATAMAAICYPREAQEYNRRGLVLVRQGIVLCLTLLRDGPQKALGRGGKKDAKDEDHTEGKGLIPNDSHEARPSQLQTETKTNNFTTLGKNFGSLGHHHEHIMEKLNSKNAQPSESKQEKKPNKRRQDDTGPPFIPGEPPVMTKGLSEFRPKTSEAEKKLSSQCEKDLHRALQGDIPSSPAPTMKHNYSEKLEPIKKIPNQDKNIGTNENSDSHNPLKTQDIHNENKLSEQNNYMYSEKNVNEYVDFQLIPTPEPVMAIEDEEQNSGQEDIHPLNKKLSRYYMKRPAEQVPSLDAGYEDLYSKRK